MQAEVAIDSTLTLAPQWAEAYFFKGKILELKEDFRQAITQYNLAIAYKADYKQAYLQRAALHFKLKNHRNYVLNDVIKAINISPDEAELYVLLAYYSAQTMDPATLKPGYTEAIAAMNEAIKLSSTNAEYYYLRSNYKLKNEQKLSALADIDKAITLGSKKPTYYHHRSVIKFTMADFRHALNDINEAIALKDSVIIYHQLRGNINYNLKRYDKAYTDYSQAIDLLFYAIYQIKGTITSTHPLNLQLRETLLLRGMALVQDNKPFDACDDFKRARQMGSSKAVNYMRKYCN